MSDKPKHASTVKRPQIIHVTLTQAIYDWLCRKGDDDFRSAPGYARKLIEQAYRAETRKEFK